ncbi:R-SNARE protein, Sec22-family [Pelomyxa schiedti]|nr:R-SNARE protein, Sec22-family [Pelomyxa schiedti]
MPLMTMIGRISDGLVLAEDMDHASADGLDSQRTQAKAIIRKIGETSPARLLIDSEKYRFFYIIQNGVCYLTLCDNSYPKKLAFSYLEELQKEFDTCYGADVRTAERPYAFIKFDSFIQKTKKLYLDTRSQRNMEKVAEDLRDVQKIMTQNLQEILSRGEKISTITNRSEELVSQTAKYHTQAKAFHRSMLWRKYAPYILVAVIIVIVLFIRFWLW